MYKRGAVGFKEKMTTDVLVPSNSFFIYCCHMVIVLNDFLVHSCWGLYWVLGFYKSKAHEAFMGSLDFFLFGLWLG